MRCTAVMLDTLAHALYCPTLAGKRCARTRWHRRIHLIPGRLLALACHLRDGQAGAT